MTKTGDKCTNITQLSWACRRGMLELDLILEPFLKSVYPTLLPAEQRLFVALLDETDQDLFNALFGCRPLKEARFLSLIEQIQRYARARPHA